MLRLISTLLIVLLSLTMARAEIIQAIDIKNNVRVSKQTIINFGKVELGKDYSENDLNIILKNLYDTNFFSDVSISIKDNILVIDVEENKIIQTLQIRGLKTKSLNEALLKEISLRDKSPYNEFQASQDLELIKNILTSYGFYFAEVRSSIQENENNTVNLIYDIELGEKALISKIEFTGNKVVKDRKLRNVITSEENRFWKFITNRKYLDYNQVERDKRLLRNYYLDKGYYQVQVRDSSAQLLDTGEFILTFNIDAGLKFKINKAELIIPDDYNEDNFTKVLKILNEMKNEEYSFTKVSKVIDQIDKISLSREYEFITAKINEEVINDNLLNLKITVSETQKKYVEKINISGNNITLERVIRDQLEVDEGDPFNELLHAKSINNLRALGIFKEVKAEIKDGLEENTKIIEINVEEKPTGELSLGAGVGTDGSSIGFSVTENNYLGKAIKLKTALEISEDSIKGIFSVVNPNFNYSDKALFTNIQSTVTDKLTKSGYKSSKTGFSFGTAFEQYDDLTISPSFSTYIEKLETNSAASSTLKSQEGDYFDTSLGYGITYDKRNRRFRTTDGYLSKFIQRLPIVADDRAVLNGYEFSKYNSWGEELVTNISLFSRAINSLDNTKDVRVSDRLSLPRSKLKGFESAKVGPKDGSDYIGGNYAASVNFSSNIPGLLPSAETLDINFFIDAANVWGVDYSSTIDDSNTIRSSTGIGVDWWTPIGPLSFSLAHPITKANTDKTQTFQFNLGTTF